MIDESTLPHRGEEIDGYRASVSTGLRPRLFRFLLHDTNLRTAYIALFIATPIGLILIWIGSKFFNSHGLKANLVGIGLCGAGGLTVIIAPFVALGTAWMAWKFTRQFRDGLLIPGVVVAADSLVIVGLADLGKLPQNKGREFGLARAEVMTLPSHSHAVGTRVPCIANFNEEGRDRFFYFAPYPVSHGTGDLFDLELCVQKLGEAPFKRLEALIARGLTPEHWNRMVVLDANDEVIDTRNYMVAGEMRAADQKLHASPQLKEANG
jgi:Protein of unknown function (DUF3239)